MSQPLEVDPQELYDRADELQQTTDALRSGLPTGYPNPPSHFRIVIDALNSLRQSAYNMQYYLTDGFAMWDQLSANLVTMADAYVEQDEQAADALDAAMGSVSSPTPRSPDGDSPVAVQSTPQEPAMVPYDPVRDQNGQAVIVQCSHHGDDYAEIYDLILERCLCIETADTNSLTGIPNSMDAFVKTWTTYRDSLQAVTNPPNDVFRSFETWQGEAASVAEAMFEQQKTWLQSMIRSCDALIQQAVTLRDAHASAWNAHVAYGGLHYQYTDFVNLYIEFEALALNPESKHDQDEFDEYMRKLEACGVQSDSVVGAYDTALGGVADINPDTYAPDVEPIDPIVGVPGGGDGPGIGDPIVGRQPPYPGGLGDNPYTPVDLTPPPSAEEYLDDFTGVPVLPTGISGGAGGAGVKPASVGGGIPSMPLQPANPAAGESVPRAGAGAGAGGGLGRGLPAGALGGPGMGVPPMVPPLGQGKGQDDKGKKSQQEDGALYTEDRAWTEAVIGNRPRRTSPDNKAAK